MGLPKPIRLGKNVEVSLEDIYMQKDYRTPKTTSALPTIIDENDPKVKKSVMTKLKRCRHIEFQTDPALRKVKISNIFSKSLLSYNFSLGREQDHERNLREIIY